MNRLSIRLLIVIFGILTIVASGGGGGGGTSDPITPDTPPTGGGGTNGSDTTPPSAPENITVVADSSGRLTVAGTAEASSIVNVTFPDNTNENTTALSNGSFSVTSLNSQIAGNISLSSTDAAGNTSSVTREAYVPTPLGKTFRLDVKEIDFTRSDNGQQLNQEGKTFEGTVIELR